MYTQIRVESQRDAGVFTRGGQGRAGHLRMKVKAQPWIPAGSSQPGENQREGRFKGLSSQQHTLQRTVPLHPR